MTCEDIREQLLEIDIEDLGTDTPIDAHLASCDDCRALAERIRASEAAVDRHIEAFANHPGFDAAFQAALVEADRPELPVETSPPWAWAAAVGGLALLAAAAGLVLFVQSFPTSLDLPGGGEEVAMQPDPGADPAPHAVALPEDRRIEAIQKWDDRDAELRARAEAEARARAEAEMDRLVEAGAALRDRLENGDVDDLVALEGRAILGELTGEEIDMLELQVGDETLRMTQRSKVSRLLMVNAFSAGDTVSWERSIKRHLETIEASDPDLAYKYALHLSKKDWRSAAGVIRWANVALENRTNWTGNTYTSRVYSLYKIRAAAAQKIWQHFESEYGANPTAESHDATVQAREQTKRFAREWLEYARVAEKPTETALSLCLSAAGTPEYCEG